MKKKEYTTVTISFTDLARLREIAEQEHRSMAQQVRHWIEQYEQKESA